MQHKISCVAISSFLVILQLQSQLTLQGPVENKVCQTAECREAAEKLKKAIDFTRDPCDDFFKFACGNFPTSYPNVDEDTPNSTLQLREEINNQEILEFITKKNSDHEPKTIHNMRKLYSLLQDKNVFSKGMEPIKELLNEYGLPEEPPFNPYASFDLVHTLAKIYKNVGLNIFFSLSPEVHPNDETKNILMLDLYKGSDLEIMQLDESKSEETHYLTSSEKHKKILEKMCNGSTSSVCEAIRATNDKVWRKLYKNFEEYERNLTSVRWDYEENENISIVSLKELQILTDKIANQHNAVVSAFNWTAYISTLYEDIDDVSLDFSKPEDIKIYVGSTSYLEGILTFIHTRSSHLHEVAIWYNLVSVLGEYTDYEVASDFGSEDISYNETVAKDLALSITQRFFGLAVSYYYVQDPQFNVTKYEVRDMVVHIKEVLKEIMVNSTWIDDITRQKAVQKLDALKSLVVYPSYLEKAADLDSFYDYMVVTDNVLETFVKSSQKKIEKKLRLLNAVNIKHDDSQEVDPSIVNAMYSPEENTIYIPAGILGTPVYEHSLRALVYGGIGVVVGHEITHGFDNDGSKYNAIGQIEEWWQNSTLDKYKEKARCFVNAYANYTENINNITLIGNSRATLGENIADNGGFKEALYAYRKYVAKNGPEPLLPSFEKYTHEQLLTLAYGNIWCENPVKFEMLSFLFSVHSPNGVRVNGVFLNSQEFANIWNCPKGSNMNPNVDKCEVW